LPPADARRIDAMDAPVSWQVPDRSQQAARQVFEHLRDLIISLALAPGTALSRAALQDQFGLSSTPIRDALMRLEQEGLVEVFPQSGTIVSLIDVPLARQAQFLRRSIEQEAVRVLAAAHDAGLVDRLEAIVREQRVLAKRGDLEAFNQADLAFHKVLYDAAGVPDLWFLVRKRSGHIDRIRRLHLPIGRKASEIISDHAAIVKAIAQRKPTAAQMALRDHLSRSLAFTEELRARFPGYFKEGAPDLASHTVARPDDRRRVIRTASDRAATAGRPARRLDRGKRTGL
jgi:DNA-binding GntR family transcriptional regulator